MSLISDLSACVVVPKSSAPHAVNFPMGKLSTSELQKPDITKLAQDQDHLRLQPLETFESHKILTAFTNTTTIDLLPSITTMASRILAPAFRAISTPSTARSFQTSARRLADATPLPVRKPVGAFRGGLVCPAYLLPEEFCGHRAGREYTSRDQVYAVVL